MRRMLWFLAISLITTALPTPARVALAQQLTSPEQFFGFQMGADRKLARWDKLVEYYHLLDRQSDRMQAVNMGPTTMGHPFLALFNLPATVLGIPVLYAWIFCAWAALIAAMAWIIEKRD